MLYNAFIRIYEGFGTGQTYTCTLHVYTMQHYYTASVIKKMKPTTVTIDTCIFKLLVTQELHAQFLCRLYMKTTKIWH